MAIVSGHILQSRDFFTTIASNLGIDANRLSPWQGSCPTGCMLIDFNHQVNSIWALQCPNPWESFVPLSPASNAGNLTGSMGIEGCIKC